MLKMFSFHITYSILIQISLLLFPQHEDLRRVQPRAAEGKIQQKAMAAEATAEVQRMHC